MVAADDPRQPRNRPVNEATPPTSAALHGALSAFAGPSAKPHVKPKPLTRSSTLNTADKARSTGGRSSVPHGPLASQTRRTTPTNLPLWTRIQPHLSDSVPSSSVAAKLAASRVAQRGDHKQLTKSVDGDGGAQMSKISEAPPESLPTAGTVFEAKGYFESLKGRQTPPDQEQATRRQSPHAARSGSATTFNKPSLKVDVGVAAASEHALEALGHLSEIHSPKPIRPSNGPPPLEKLTDGSDDDPSAPEVVDRPPTKASLQSPLQAVARKPDLSTPSRSLGDASFGVAHSRHAIDKPSEAVHTGRSQHQQSRPTIARAKTHGGPLTMSKRSSQAAQFANDSDAHRIDALANAIVASSLATSRVPSRTSSPAKTILPPVPRRLTDSNHVFHPGVAQMIAGHDSRTPSPKKGFRHTMRKTPSPVDPYAELAEKHKRSHFHMRKHPHKHREGDRKRWRDEITLLERKRYEGLWAANKDLYTGITSEESQLPTAVAQGTGHVANIVVKDIWSRSRLPPHVLEEIWDLVDRERVGRLNREAFVVGTWLVDQRLKGRKMPVKVGDSVWHSARGIYGLKMPKFKA